MLVHLVCNPVHTLVFVVAVGAVVDAAAAVGAAAGERQVEAALAMAVVQEQAADAC